MTQVKLAGPGGGDDDDDDDDDDDKGDKPDTPSDDLSSMSQPAPADGDDHGDIDNEEPYDVVVRLVYVFMVEIWV